MVTLLPKKVETGIAAKKNGNNKNTPPRAEVLLISPGKLKAAHPS